jgi:hypothetical protein
VARSIYYSRGALEGRSFGLIDAISAAYCIGQVDSLPVGDRAERSDLAGGGRAGGIPSATGGVAVAIRNGLTAPGWESIAGSAAGQLLIDRSFGQRLKPNDAAGPSCRERSSTELHQRLLTWLVQMLLIVSNSSSA